MSTRSGYTVRADDTLQTIAQLQLGSASLWPQIAALNKLRAPYISALPTDQLGPLLAQFTTAAPIAVADTSIALPAGSGGIIYPGMFVALRSYSTAGTVTWEMAQVTSVGTTTAPVTVVTAYNSLTRALAVSATGFAASHPAGAVLYVYANPALLDTAVARIGDTLALPQSIKGQATGGALSVQSLLGTSIALDGQGLVRIGADGKVPLVSGADNVKQAVRIILQLTPGELPHQPTLGNRANFYIGAKQTRNWYGLIGLLSQDAVASDPRIAQVVVAQAGPAQGLPDAAVVRLVATTIGGVSITADATLGTT